MILLAIASCLLFFVTYFTGIFTQHLLKKFLLPDFGLNFFETFLLGLMACFVYFNLLSFFTPINYKTLFPLLVISIFSFAQKATRQLFLYRVSQTTKLLFSGNHFFFVLPFIVLFFIYWIIPPLNADSGEYHYISIRWYEQFKVVPGLANVHARLAFNPASFIVSAAWSFSDIAGQALYPLNGVLTVVFYTWLIKKILLQPVTLYHLILYLAGIMLFRNTIINITSPSSDLLSGLLLFYCGFRTYELINEDRKSFGDYFIIILLTCFSVTAKLAAIPLLLLVPVSFFLFAKKGKQAAIVIKSILPVILIIVPWLVRNAILSGYLLYPVAGTNLFHFDWTVPPDVLKLDFIYTKYGTRTAFMAADFFSPMQKMNAFELIKIWLGFLYKAQRFMLVVFLIAACSPLLWFVFPILKKKIPANIFVLWLIYYTCVMVWMINSPEFRFGLSYLVLAAAIPVLELTKILPPWKIYLPALSFLMFACCTYYGFSAFNHTRMYKFSLSDCWLKPLKDGRYFKKNDLSTFASVPLGNGVTLYIADKQHECLNANGPCMNWRYGEIEMRGNKIEDGFRNVKDEVKKYFPFVQDDK